MDHSYAELTKAYALSSLQKKEKSVQSLYIDILLYEAILKEKRDKLKQEIDAAIDMNDKERFFRLVRQLITVEAELNA